MSKYVKNIDWSQYEDMTDEEVYDLYESIEEHDKEKDRKQVKKMHDTQGYDY